ncbi:MAG: acetate kinase [Thermomicrobiales bacterium]
MSVVLVINSGSSSIKYQLIEMAGETVLAKGLIERIGTDNGIITHTGQDGTAHRTERPILDHVAGFRAMMDACNAWGPRLDGEPIVAVGHRVVQGGARFIQPTLIDDAAVRILEEISSLAPLHNPPNLLGIAAARTAFPELPQIAVFDTAFHQTMPPVAYTYAIDAALANQYRIRKYGFHGTSHKYVSERAAEMLDIPHDDLNAITLHIGNGVSACAIRGGRSIDTSMGMTPLEGLVMGTRSGDLDPGIIFHLSRQAGMSIDQMDDLLNRRSGMLGLTGSSDLRDVQESAARGDRRAELALDVYCQRIRHYVGAYITDLDPLHAIVFTAGVGENSAVVRERSLAGMERFGIRLDPERNRARSHGPRRISPDDAPVAVLVIPTNEELEIARQTISAIG